MLEQKCANFCGVFLSMKATTRLCYPGPCKGGKMDVTLEPVGDINIGKRPDRTRQDETGDGARQFLN
jgi:hypothetical protein